MVSERKKQLKNRPKGIQLKPAKPYHVQRVTQLFSLIDSKVKSKKIHQLIKEGRVYILKYDKRIIAAFSFTIFSLLGFLTLMYIQKLSVVPDFQGKGIGTYMLSRIKRTSLKVGAAAFFLFSVKTAQKFYERNKLKRLWRFFWWKKA